MSDALSVGLGFGCLSVLVLAAGFVWLQTVARVIAYLDRRGEQRATAELGEELEALAARVDKAEQSSKEALDKARDVHAANTLGRRR